MEILFPLIGGSVVLMSVYALITGHITAVSVQRDVNQAIITPAPAQVPKAIQEEIEQTPNWWAGEFHKLLKRSGEPESTLVDESWEPDVITEKSANGSVCVQYVQSRPAYFESCMCGSCTKNRNPNGWWQSDVPF